jgi:hypothetical protein
MSTRPAFAGAGAAYRWEMSMPFDTRSDIPDSVFGVGMNPNFSECP